MFDGDAAGRKAAARALATALPFASEKNRIDFAFLPSGHDPDSLIRESGADALNGLVRSAKPLSAWILDLAAQGQAMEFAEGRAAALAELAGMLKTMSAGPLRSQIVREAARRFDAPESAILNDIGERLPSQIDSRNRYSPRPSSRDQRPTVRPLAERLLQILVRQPDWAGQIPSRLIEHLEATQSALIHWIRAKTQQASVANFAVLHEAALAEGREKGPDEVKLFIKLARPDAALDALEESDPEALRAEFERAISRLTIRFLEEEAKRLTVAAQTDANALGELTRVRAEIQALKA
jgi:DNA primase